MDHWHAVEYESLNLICSKCDYYEHVAATCNLPKVEGITQLGVVSWRHAA